MDAFIDSLLRDHLLSAITFLPLATVLLLALVEALVGLPESGWKWTSLGASLVGAALTILLWQRFDPAASGLQLVEHSAWIPEYGIHYTMGVDGIALLLGALTSFLLPIVLIASWTDIAKRVRSFLFFMMALQTGMLGAFFALDLFLFYVFWETMLIPMYFVIGIWGGPRRVYATVKFFIYTMDGSLLMLSGFIHLAWLHHPQFGALTFSYYSSDRPTRQIVRLCPTLGGEWLHGSDDRFR